MSVPKTSPWVIVAEGFHNQGGMDKANLALAEYLLDQEIPVHLVTLGAERRLEQHPLATVHRVPRPAQSFLLGEFVLAVRARRIVRRMVAQNPRVRVVVNGGNCVWPGINWAHYVHHAWSGARDGSLPYRIKGWLGDRWGRTTERAAFRRARMVIANSKRTSREVVEYFGIDESRVHTVYLGSDPDWGRVSNEERASSRRALQIPESRTVAAFVGGLGYDHRKGFDVLFSVWEKLCARPEWDVDLLVAGGGPAEAKWRSEIQRAGLSDRIRLLGFSGDVQSVLAAVDLLVSPVRYEAYGLNVQEAICRGVPAMVSASAGIAERYEPDLVPMLIPDPDDIDNLVQRLLAWRAQMQAWRSRFEPLGRRLRSRTWRDTAADFVSLVQQESFAEANSLPALARQS